MALYQYQKENYQTLVGLLKEGKNPMYQLPTGGGKTRVISEIVVEDFSTKNVLILAHRRELLFQMENTLLSRKLHAPGVIIGDISRNLDSNVLIGSVSTLSRDNRLDSELLQRKFDLVVIDEAHRLRTPSYDKLLTHIKEVNPEVQFLGVTATPWRYDKKEFTEYLDVLVKGKSVKELISEGYLSKFKTYTTSIGDIDSEVEKSGEDYNLTQLSNYMRKPELIQHGISQYTELGKGKQCLVYTVDKKHLESVVEAFKKAGYNSIDSIIAETPNREKIIERYLEGNLQILVSIGTLTEGTDLPDTGCLLILRPTDSVILFHQILGRGMRVSSDGSELIILDCGGLTKKFGLVDSTRNWSLDPSVNPVTKKRTKLVAKKKDGTYTDNLEEIEMGDLEVEEMTPEEYLLHCSNSIEEANKFNQEIEEKVNQIRSQFVVEFKRLLDELILNIEGMILSEMQNINLKNFTLSNMSLELPSLNSSLSFRYLNGYMIPSVSYIKSLYGNVNEEDIKKSLQSKILEGKLSSELLVNKGSLSKVYESTTESINSLREQKIDISELRKKQKEFRKSQLELRIHQLLLKSKTIYLSIPCEGFTFREVPYDGNGQIVSIKFNQERFLSTNKLDFYGHLTIPFWQRKEALMKGKELPEFNTCRYNSVTSYEKSKLLEILSSVEGLELSSTPYSGQLNIETEMKLIK